LEHRNQVIHITILDTLKINTQLKPGDTGTVTGITELPEELDRQLQIWVKWGSVIVIPLLIIPLLVVLVPGFEDEFQRATEETGLSFLLVKLAYAQNNTGDDGADLSKSVNGEDLNPFGKAIREAQLVTSARKNVSTVNAPMPKMFNSIEEGDIAPYPVENQIVIEIRSFEFGDPDIGKPKTPLRWRGNVLYNDGTDMISFDGVGENYILVNCFAYDRYAVSFQQTDPIKDDGHLDVRIWYRDADYDKYGQKMLDGGTTKAAYGIVQLSGECKDPKMSND
jgi:hypothetical protein